MWQRRLLTERGSAAVDSILGVIFIMIVALGVIEVALGLYARNTVLAAVHDGARAAVEVGGTSDRADALAMSTIEHSAGGLIHGVEVHTEVTRRAERLILRVFVRGTLDPPGPIPWHQSIFTSATAERELFGDASD